jgi:hypothetical protein
VSQSLFIGFLLRVLIFNGLVTTILSSDLTTLVIVMPLSVCLHVCIYIYIHRYMDMSVQKCPTVESFFILVCFFWKSPILGNFLLCTNDCFYET